MSDYVTTGSEHTLNTGATWEWFSLVQKGKLQAEFASRCPRTTELVTDIPGLMLGTPFSYCFFSALPPGARIEPHFGPANLRLRVHLPLIVPDGCTFRIADETRAWKVGKCFVFDDTFEHEVVHDGQDERVVLLLDVWHPDLSKAEITAVQGMFEEARQAGWLS